MKRGKSFKYFPIRIAYSKYPLDTEFPAQVAFSVSKKRFKHAASRNRVKRLLREAYRKHKYILYNGISNKSFKVAIFIMFLSREEPTYKEVEAKIILSLQRLVQELTKA